MNHTQTFEPKLTRQNAQRAGQLLAETIQDASRKKNIKMNVILSIVQALLAMLFFMSGYMKAFQPLDVLAQSIQWTQDVPAPLVRFIGVSEMLGAMGLVVPAVTRIWLRSTVFAAAALAIVMVSASIFHASRGEFFALPMTVALFALAALVVYGRWKLVPFSSRD